MARIEGLEGKQASLVTRALARVAGHSGDAYCPLPEGLARGRI